MGEGIVLVTGAASGIGLATARHLAARGWAVAMLDREADRLVAEVEPLGAAATAHALDVTDEAAVGATVATIAARGPIRGLVNSAGIAAGTPFDETSAAAFRRILDVNVIGTFLVAREVVPCLERAGGGSIVNVASVTGIQGNWGRTAYGASKGAVVTMTKVMAVELAERGVRVNAVAPGPIDTPMVQVLHDAAEREMWLTHTPMRRYGQPEEIAAGIAFLLDPTQSSYVTGHVLPIDGGFVAGGTLKPYRPDAISARP